MVRTSREQTEQENPQTLIKLGVICSYDRNKKLHGTADATKIQESTLRTVRSTEKKIKTTE
jgi:hypothetical protein